MNSAKLLVTGCIMVTLSPHAFSQIASVSPSALAFTPQVINLVSAGSRSQAVTVTNTGTTNLVVTSITASGGYQQTNDCSTVPFNESCTINVTFEPGTLGNVGGAITIVDNAASSPQVVNLSGQGIAPARLSPSTTNFGTVEVGKSSQPKVIKLTANSTLSINQIATSGNFTQTNTCATLQAGQSCTITVVFTPTINAAVTGALSVSTVVGTTALPFSAALSGTGSGNIVSNVSIQPASLTFENKGPDLVDSVKELTLTNTSGNTSLTIHGVSLSGSSNAVGAFPMYKINSNNCTGMLAPGAHCKVAIAFSTTFSRVFPLSYLGAVTFTDSDVTGAQVIGLSAKQVPQLTFSPTSLVFPAQTVGTTATKTVSVTGNDIQAGLILDVISSGDFTESGDFSGCVLQQGGTCTMTVSFTPTRAGVLKGAITLETYPECNPFPLHQCADPVVLSLTGTGQ